MSDVAQSVAFFDSTFEQAVALTREARDYVAYQKRADLAELTSVGRLSASSESMRVTARLTHIVAWLMVQKAVHAGEMTREEATDPQYRLGGQAVCRHNKPVADAPLPRRLVDLRDRSDQLYERVVRLDAMIDQKPG
ncbi:MAG: DUF1465 family protein [Kiloniellaceae bacterium]